MTAAHPEWYTLWAWTDELARNSRQPLPHAKWHVFEDRDEAIAAAREKATGDRIALAPAWEPVPEQGSGFDADVILEEALATLVGGVTDAEDGDWVAHSGIDFRKAMRLLEEELDKVLIKWTADHGIQLDTATIDLDRVEFLDVSETKGAA